MPRGVGRRFYRSSRPSGPPPSCTCACAGGRCVCISPAVLTEKEREWSWWTHTGGGNALEGPSTQPQVIPGIPARALAGGGLREIGATCDAATLPPGTQPVSWARSPNHTPA
jgi:hypothetical protein